MGKFSSMEEVRIFHASVEYIEVIQTSSGDFTRQINCHFFVEYGSIYKYVWKRNLMQRFYGMVHLQRLHQCE